MSLISPQSFCSRIRWARISAPGCQSAFFASTLEKGPARHISRQVEDTKKKGESSDREKRSEIGTQTHHGQQPPHGIAGLGADADPVPRAKRIELDVLVALGAVAVGIFAGDGVVGAEDFEGFAVAGRPGARERKGQFNALWLSVQVVA